MTVPGSERNYRQPPQLEVLAQRSISGLRLKLGPHWYRLAPDRYAQAFYASRSSRFTPASWEYPCAYLACDPATCFAELYGDQMAQHAIDAPGQPFAIPASFARARSLYQIDDAPEVHLCDFTNGDTLVSLGLDLTTIYSLDLSLTQSWAELIAQLPGRFDGIRYYSRHTAKFCLVLWNRLKTAPLNEKIEFRQVAPLLDAPFAFEIAKLLNARLSYPADF